MHSIHVTMHRVLMGGLAVAVLAAAVGVLQPWDATASAQHGGHQDARGAAEHFAAVADMLELTDDQRTALEGPFGHAFQKLHELQQIHGMIAAELTDDQKMKFIQMLHENLTNAFGHDGTPHGRHGDHEPDHR